MTKCFRVVLTGGPGGGKTVAADLFRREIGDQVVVVPEAATLLFTGGFPRGGGILAARSAQKAIYHVQRNLEDAQSGQFKNRILLCDRGTVDGAAYWPNHDEDFFDQVGTSLAQELARYDAVIFFESAAAGGISIEGGNPTRIESVQDALNLDRKLKGLWSQHPKFIFVPHQQSFIKKVNIALTELAKLLAQFQHSVKE